MHFFFFDIFVCLGIVVVCCEIEASLGNENVGMLNCSMIVGIGLL